MYIRYYVHLIRNKSIKCINVYTVFVFALMKIKIKNYIYRESANKLTLLLSSSRGAENIEITHSGRKFPIVKTKLFRGRGRDHVKSSMIDSTVYNIYFLTRPRRRFRVASSPIRRVYRVSRVSNKNIRSINNRRMS